MISETKDSFINLKREIGREKQIINEFSSLKISEKGASSLQEKKMISSHLYLLNKKFKEVDMKIRNLLDLTIMKNPLPTVPQLNIPKQRQKSPHLNYSNKNNKIIQSEESQLLERSTLKRLRRKEVKRKEIKEKKPSAYIETANKLFSETSIKALESGKLRNLKRDLIKAGIPLLARSYISVSLLTTLISCFVGLFIFLFFLFFNLGPTIPFLTLVNTPFITRLLQTFWILFFVPLVTLLAMYIYPTLEKQSIENKINQELPFAAIHMSSISGSMIEPSKIFSVIISTGEYPYLNKEFTKLLNEVNVFGYDLVTALRNIAFNSPSKKLSELLNGLATTITSGGDLSEFFDKRSQTLLFDYRIEREKATKSAETFMDIYISVVIASPMILMLLLIMMKISGLGISLSTTAISLLMVAGVAIVNIIFLVFLQLKQESV